MRNENNRMQKEREYERVGEFIEKMNVANGLVVHSVREKTIRLVRSN